MDQVQYKMIHNADQSTLDLTYEILNMQTKELIPFPETWICIRLDIYTDGTLEKLNRFLYELVPYFSTNTVRSKYSHPYLIIGRKNCNDLIYVSSISGINPNPLFMSVRWFIKRVKNSYHPTEKINYLELLSL